MADTELPEYITLYENPKDGEVESVYELPQMMMDNRSSSPIDRIQDQVMDSVPQQLQQSNTQDLVKTKTTISNANKLMATCLTMLFAVNIVILSLLVFQISNTADEITTAILKKSNAQTSGENTGITQLLASHMEILSSVNLTVLKIQSTVDNLTSVKNAVDQMKAIVQNTQTILEQTNTEVSPIKIAVNLTKGLVETISQNISNLLRIPKSCQEMRIIFPSSTSGYYYINNEEVVYCEMGELCGVNGGWSRLAYLDMTDNTVNCPSALRLYNSSGSVRACGRPTNNSGSCASVTFPSHGISYSEVCGRVVGYQYGSPDGVTGSDINSYYVDGVSITSGNPRTHVWTLIGEYSEPQASCPCSSQYSGSSLPSFIGNDSYFCESGNQNNPWLHILYTADPLWDGEGCGSHETGCCSGPPWFNKTIPTTTDYLEMRICGDEDTNNEDTPVSVYEIYVI